ncbi:MATE family efflux transporter [Polyangium aurulentum]|uniref:MATE family efflux transporter n=1 Tax=Polyangium aurulentum TaxID=2567896 RepID=UPI0010AE0656|nr:MATE family efflux transporter [Polyangium aurulentum]UQA62656.1 MATE family efflux transporter [Polyangium aurulentum]
MGATTDLAEAPNRDAPPARGLWAEVRGLAVLAGPITLSQVGLHMMGFVDTAMVGRLGATSLAAVGIGNGIYFSLSVASMGVIFGMDPLVSQAIGAGESARARSILWQAVRLALLISVPTMALVALAAMLVGYVGIDPETSHQIWRFLLGRLPNIVPFLIFTACRSYLQAIGRTRAILWATVWANIANVVGNILFIYGDEGLAWFGLPRVGLPPLGVLGSGLASSIASVATVVVAGREVVRVSGKPRAADLRPDSATMRSIARLGMPIGVHLISEVGAFSLVGILAGRLGPEVAAGHQVALGLASMSFTVALGLANATAVQVGHAVGRGDTLGARRAGFVGIVASLVVMGVPAIAFAAAPYACARILSDKPEIIVAALPLIRIAALFQLWDGSQAVASGALRGAGDTRSAQFANMAGYYLLGLPLALLLGFGMGFGAVGFWWGLSAALAVISVGLVIQFWRVSSRDIQRA